MWVSMLGGFNAPILHDDGGLLCHTVNKKRAVQCFLLDQAVPCVLKQGMHSRGMSRGVHVCEQAWPL